MQQKHAIVWRNVCWLAAWHAGALYALCAVCPRAPARVLWFALALWPLTGLGITAGAHRLWAHRSYRASLPLQVALMALNTMAFQGSIWEWVRDHRVHHKGVDTDADPYNIRRGFFFAHMGWIMVRKHARVQEMGRKIDFTDLERDSVVQFQRRHYLLLVLALCYGLPTAAGAALGDAWAGFWVAGVLRHVWVLHMTWCVNSVAHIWGMRPYRADLTAAENWGVSAVALGEGWHNFHHAYPHDYRSSAPARFNLTTLVLDACAAMGAVTQRKVARSASRPC